MPLTISQWDIPKTLWTYKEHASKSECGHLDLVSVGRFNTWVKAEMSQYLLTIMFASGWVFLTDSTDKMMQPLGPNFTLVCDQIPAN